ncbi:MAG: hypothetical protein CMJ18_18090 [Phycisphaeraceae bacterium]|nr:hypothetical protein [Phycisphaeraceae bacterium]
MSDGATNRWRHWQIDLVGVAICAAVSMGVYFLMLRPLSERNRAYAAEHAQLIQQREQSVSVAETCRSLEEELERVRTHAGHEALELRDPDLINEVLASLADLSRQTRLKIDQMQPMPVAQVEHFAMVPVHVRGTGTIRDCARLLRRLHQEPRFRDIAVRSFDISGDPRSAMAKISFRLVLTWYTTAEAKP